MQTWHWQTGRGTTGEEISYLTCSLLEPWPHGFFTKQATSPTPRELIDILTPQAQCFRAKQVHGKKVLSASEIKHFHEQAQANEELSSNLPNLESQFPEADGVLTQNPHEAAWVCTADCTPALIADIGSGNVAAVHAGWRGTALAIVPQAIAQLQAQGSQLQDLRIALGPAISGAVYQVSTQVATEVGASVNPGTITDSAQTEENAEAILGPLRNLPNPPILDDPQPGRVRLDVRRINALQLEKLGIDLETQVEIAPHCTYQEPDLFFSYRRNRLKRVQWSGIVSQSRS